jgi:hypothetical protein
MNDSIHNLAPLNLLRLHAHEVDLDACVILIILPSFFSGSEMGWLLVVVPGVIWGASFLLIAEGPQAVAPMERRGACASFLAWSRRQRVAATAASAYSRWSDQKG